jgi:hypothetical protein
MADLKRTKPEPGKSRDHRKEIQNNAPSMPIQCPPPVRPQMHNLFPSNESSAVVH